MAASFNHLLLNLVLYPQNTTERPSTQLSSYALSADHSCGNHLGRCPCYLQACGPCVGDFSRNQHGCRWRQSTASWHLLCRFWYPEIVFSFPGCSMYLEKDSVQGRILKASIGRIADDQTVRDGGSRRRPFWWPIGHPGILGVECKHNCRGYFRILPSIVKE